MQNILFVTIACCTLLFACSKGEKPQIDSIGPLVEILVPQDGALLPAGDSSRVEITIEENLGLHSYYIWLVDETGMPQIIDKQHLHVQAINIEKTFLVPDSPGQRYRIRVEAHDHDENSTAKTVEILIK